MTNTTLKLAALGGPKAMDMDAGDIFRWPIVTEEDEQAVLDVLRAGVMSGTDITQRFEQEFAEWSGTKYALGYCNGTASLLGGMFGCGVGAGDEVIAPSMTYWATALPALTLQATIVFADIDRATLCIAPEDIEHRITGRTKAIVLTHNYGHPADMDRIMPIARKHNLRVIEDVSHAQGGLYKGRKLGAIGDVGCMSMMAGKAFAAGEAGMLVTDDRTIWERAIAFGFYGRTKQSTYATADAAITDPELAKFKGLPLGGAKHRMNQTCSAMGRVQLKYYDERMAEIQRAMNRFWDLLEGCPGIKPHRVKPESGSTMGGWYMPKGLYYAEELGGLSCKVFCQAVRAEGVSGVMPGADFPLHLHPMLQEADIYHHGKPTLVAHAGRDLRQGRGSLPISESIDDIAIWIPWFKKDYPKILEAHAQAFRKVAERADQLLEEDNS